MQHRRIRGGAAVLSAPDQSLLHVAMTFVGCVISAQVLWDAADFCNGVMCIPNLFSLILFAGLIAKDTKKYIDPLK